MENRLKRVLVAAPAEALERVPRSLGGYYDYQIVTSLDVALSSLDDGFDCILCGLDFDEGRMFDLLRYVKANPLTKGTPFFCVKGAEGMLSPALLQSVEIACAALGAAGFIELYEWRSALGDEAAFAKMRTMIDVST